MVKHFRTKVAETGITKLIQRYGRDCKPTQFVREYLMNSIEAIQRTKEPGTIIVDVNWDIYNQISAHKISFLDTGDGMTMDEMIEHLNNLSSSGSTENQYENYGMGAKIAALTRNHAGIMYDSWKDGTGSRIFICFNEQEQVYGIRPVENYDHSVEWGTILDEEDKPKEILKSGTRVTLFGDHIDHDTMLPPSGAKGGRENWIFYYINSRFFEIPEYIEIKVRTGYYRDYKNRRHNYLRTLKGQRNTLNENSVSRGSISISDAEIYWWILNPGVSGHGRENLSGHTACLNQNEIFDVTDGRSNRAQHFGIILGKEDVVLYVEPKSDDIVQDTTRTRLLKTDGSEMPWERWQDEFREAFPAELELFIKEKLATTKHEDRDESIRKRLSQMREFYKLSMYKQNEFGTHTSDPDSEINRNTGTGSIETSSEGVRRGPQDGDSAGPIAQLLRSRQKPDGEKSSVVSPSNFPVVLWISQVDNTRGKGELEDRAAEFLEKENALKINQDFQGFHDVFRYYKKRYSDFSGGEEIIWETVRGIFEQQLVETVIGAQQLKNRPNWTPEDYQNAISQEALTTAVMTRYFVINYLDTAFKKKISNFISGNNIGATAGLG